METVPEKQLQSLLTSSHLLAREDWEEAGKEARRTKKDIAEILVEKGMLTDEELGTVIADTLGMPFVRLAETTIPEDILTIIPEPMGRAQRVIAFARNREGIKVAMANPENLETIRFLTKRTGERIIPHYATPRDIENALSRYHQFASSFSGELGRLASHAISGAGGAGEEAVIALTDLILRYGAENRASDIHIEPHRKKTNIRLRIDGILHDVGTLPLSIHERVVARIKVLGRMRLDEHRSAQDGRFRFSLRRLPVDVRVSIVPITKGERVVLRLLSDQNQYLRLEDLGFSGRNFETVRRNLTQPWGMILATGPTGSGKTTSLYAMLEVLNTRAVNISTIEDPVEYDIEGVNQIQVNPKTNLTFASGLRAIVRQNPDIIMVGEIRDSETAKIAVNAAMTGHLVLSTLHTNDAATALPRLIDMGIEPFLIASTVNLIIAQRLVRKICMQCIESYSVSREKFRKEHPNLLAIIEKSYSGKRGLFRLYRAKRCAACGQTEYSGRTGIFEILEVSEEIRELIRARQDADRIRAQARAAGMTTLLEDGIAKMIAGITTLEEVLRVTREEEV